MNDARTYPVDEDLVARYVLGRASADEQALVEQRMAADPRWQTAVDAERRIVAGIRRVGREALKARLQRSVEQSGHPRRWHPAFSAAALILVIAGIGVFYEWNRQGTLEQHQGPLPQITARIPDTIRANPARDGNETSPAPSVGEMRADKDMTAKKAERQQPAQQNERYTFGIEEKAKTKNAPEPARRERDAPPAVTGQTMNVEAYAGKVASLAGEKYAFWIEGTLLDSKTDALSDLAEPRSESGRAAGGDALRKETATMEDETMQQQFRVTQQPATSLPAGQNRMNRLDQVNTLVTREGDDLRLTLYPETPIAESELQQARVEQVGTDSIIVTLPSQRIGYRIPGLSSLQKARVR